MTERRQFLSRYLFQFYSRRAFRLFPAYFAYLAVLAALWIGFGAAPGVRQYWLPLVTYTLNFSRASPLFGEDPFIRHLWSLGVEEQFYLVWPLLLYVIPTRRRLAVFGVLMAAGGLFRWGTSAVLAARGLNDVEIGRAIYVLPWSHQDAFAAGAFAWLIRSHVRRSISRLWAASTAVVLASGSVLVLALHAGRPLSFGFPAHLMGYGREIWGYTLLNLWFAATVLLAYYDRPLVRPLNWGGLVYLGRISYAMYLWHMLAEIVVFQSGVSWPAGTRLLVALALSIGLASLSTYALERPLLALRDRLLPSLPPPIAPQD